MAGGFKKAESALMKSYEVATIMVLVLHPTLVVVRLVGQAMIVLCLSAIRSASTTGIAPCLTHALVRKDGQDMHVKLRCVPRTATMVENALHQTFANAKPGQQSFVTCAKVVGVLCFSRRTAIPCSQAGLDTIVTHPFVCRRINLLPTCEQGT